MPALTRIYIFKFEHITDYIVSSNQTKNFSIVSDARDDTSKRLLNRSAKLPNGQSSMEPNIIPNHTRT